MFENTDDPSFVAQKSYACTRTGRKTTRIIRILRFTMRWMGQTDHTEHSPEGCCTTTTTEPLLLHYTQRVLFVLVLELE